MRVGGTGQSGREMDNPSEGPQACMEEEKAAEKAPEPKTVDRYLELPSGSFGLRQDRADYDFAFIT